MAKEYRQYNITLTKKQIEYIKAHPEESVISMATKWGMSTGKVSANMQLLGIGREQKQVNPQWENADGTFNETEFGKFYNY